NIANSNDMDDYRAWLYDWTSNPNGHLGEIWRQMRTVYRSHTTDSALAILARTAGISVRGLKPLDYTACLSSTEHVTSEQRRSWIVGVLNQSVRPRQIVISDLSEDEKELVEERGVRARTQPDTNSENHYQIFFPEEFSRTFAEDVLLPFRFGQFSTICLAPSNSYEPGSSLVTPVDNAENGFDVVVTYSGNQGGAAIVTLPVQVESSETDNDAEEAGTTLEGKVVLVAGH